MPVPVCDAAQSATERFAPEAADLTAKCRASGGGQTLKTVGQECAAKGTPIVAADPLLTTFRMRQPAGDYRTGFDMGVGCTAGDSLWGPGKQRIVDSLTPAQQQGFLLAASFVMDRNRNPQWAAIGAKIAATDAPLNTARTSNPDVRYWLGFDIATGLFGDPKKGAQGNTQAGPGSNAILAALSAPAQSGFLASRQLHFSRHY